MLSKQGDARAPRGSGRSGDFPRLRVRALDGGTNHRLIASPVSRRPEPCPGSTAAGNLPGARSRPDEAGRRALTELERTLVDRTLSDKPKAREDWFNPEEVNELLRRYPATEIAFLFPVPVPIPATRFQVRDKATHAGIDRADHPVFYIEVSDVRVTDLAVTQPFFSATALVRPERHPTASCGSGASGGDSAPSAAEMEFGRPIRWVRLWSATAHRNRCPARC